MKLVRAFLLLEIATARGFGSAACAECHLDIYQQQMGSRHAQALRPFSGSRMAMLLTAAAEPNGTRFEYSGDTVSLSFGGERAQAKLEWAFGAGSLGFTAVGRLEGRYFEHRVSYFLAAGRDAITPGQPVEAQPSARDALGVFKTPQDAYLCFNCHSTGLSRASDGQPDVSGMTPGIHCERCHGTGQRHIQAAHQHRSPQAIRRAIFSASRLPVKASVEVCGGCHRTTAAIDDPATVRFQPVGVMASRCFRASARLSCLTCHSAHSDAVRNDGAFYRAKCLECHADSKTKVIACKRDERANCLPCHMRRQALLPYMAFTDHRIRVY